MPEWVRTDLGYAARISNLRGPSGGLNGLNFLDSDTVFSDFASDTLTGGLGLDWFFAVAEDVITDLDTTNEVVN